MKAADSGLLLGEISLAVITELFDGFGSGVLEEIPAVVATVPSADAPTEYVDVITALEPAASVPSEQGKAVTHAPEFETKFKTAGVGLLTATSRASEGPLFLTVVT